MKNVFKKKVKSSTSVIRAINRINRYSSKETSRSIVWDGKSITYLSNAS